MGFREFYSRRYKKLMLLPIVLILVSLIIISIQYSRTNDIMDKDVTLKGGITVTVNTEKEIDNLGDLLKSEFKTDFIVRKLTEFGTEKQIGMVIDTDTIDSDKLKASLEDILKIDLNQDNYSIEETSPILAASFYRQMMISLVFAFISMALVVFIIFRTLIPSIAVISSALFDLTTTIAVIDLLDIKISTAGIAALLLIMGYSLDTDLLLTIKVIKRKEGQIMDRVFDSIKTGLTMTATTFIALGAGYLLSNSLVLKEMFLIIIIGLLADVIITYLFNAPIVIDYMKKKEHA